MSRLLDVLPGVPIVESPFFYALLDELELSPAERQVAIDLHERGVAIFDFPDVQIQGRVDRIKTRLTPRFDTTLADRDSVKTDGAVRRIQDAWHFDEDVRAIAANDEVLSLLGKLYGRRAFPFQTLNFPVGTEQHLHSDSIHFSSIPERFMCGVWLAMEDIEVDAGPLTYLAGSHKWPILSNVMIARRGWRSALDSAQAPFESVWSALVANSQERQEVFLPKKGQALIWAANLLHGGSVQHNKTLTRWSQVTHYYFEECIYYTPAFSDEPLGQLDLRTITNIATGEIEPNTFLGEEVPGSANVEPRTKWRWPRLNRSASASEGTRAPSLPADFDPEAYLRFNPDVAAAKIDPAEHYLRHGAQERRRYLAGA